MTTTATILRLEAARDAKLQLALEATLASNARDARIYRKDAYLLGDAIYALRAPR